MPSLHEVFSKQFHAWERRGRGWQVFAHPVMPEPPLVEFPYSSPEETIDDGRRPTILSSLVGRFTRGNSDRIGQIRETIEEPKNEPFERTSILELGISLPYNAEGNEANFSQFLRLIAPSQEPAAFEILAMGGKARLQIAASRDDGARIKKQISAFFPEANIAESKNRLIGGWVRMEGHPVIFEFGLAREFVLPLLTEKFDLYIGIAAAFSDIARDSVAVFQVIFQPLGSLWNESIVRSLVRPDGKPMFPNEKELTGAGSEKASQMLFAAVVRVAVKTPEAERSWRIAKDIAVACAAYSNPTGNELIPLQNDEYPIDLHEEDLLLRQTHRSGMILTLDELLGFTHLPSLDVPSLGRLEEKTKSAPDELNTGILLGHNSHAGDVREVRLSPEHRVRHVHILGASGTGKTTLIYNLIREDIENGRGVAVLEPHGDLVEKILGSIPPHRINDVVLIDPSDEECSVGFNILSAHSDVEKHLLASDLVSIFERLSTSWGDQMGSVLSNAILAFLESLQGGTLADLRRFLIEPAYRTSFLQSVQDPEVLYYWKKAFPQLTGNRSLGPILTRLETFLAPKPIRYMVSQKDNKLDFAAIMDSGKIFLAKLSEGLLGKSNSYLLGALILAKFQQIAMGRQRQAASSRRDFFLYIDEFPNFISPSIAEILAGARKYRLGLVLAHQELRQLERNKEVASAVLSNCATQIVFRVSDNDAKTLSDGFSSFDARDFQNLPIGHAICRVERSDVDFNLTIPEPVAIDEEQANKSRSESRKASRATYGTPRSEIQKALEELWKTESNLKDVAAPKDVKNEKTVEPTFRPVAKTPLPPPAQTSPQAVAKSPTITLPGLGRGGAQHKAIQQRIKKAAEKIGFQASIEKTIPNGSVDLLLESETVSIACEISITTTIDHEVGNVLKCFDAGFEIVTVICVDPERLNRIRAAVAGALGENSSRRVLYFTPDDFIAEIPALLPRPTPKETVEKRLGYTVKRLPVNLSSEEAKEKEQAMIRAIAEAMKKPKPRE